MLTAYPAHSRARGRSPRSTNRGGVDGRCPAGVGIPDPNGNRESALNSAGVSTAAFDNQDRILSSGDYESDFTPNGELASKTNILTNDVTTCAYDAIGNLLTVNLPNGNVIEYLVDAARRRVGKKANGVLERRGSGAASSSPSPSSTAPATWSPGSSTRTASTFPSSWSRPPQHTAS